MHSYAQSIHQLYLQLLDKRYSESDLLKVKAAYGLQCDLFAGLMTGSGKPQLSHGIGTASILASFDAPRHVVVAGMIHGAYGLGMFGDKASGLTEQRRSEVRKIVGQAAEQCVEAYYRMSPWTRETVARISSRLEELDQTERDTLLIHLADDLEHHLDLGLLYRGNGVMLKQARERRGATAQILERLRLPELAAQFRLAYTAYDSSRLPSVLYEQPQAPRQLLPRSMR